MRITAPDLFDEYPFEFEVTTALMGNAPMVHGRPMMSEWAANSFIRFEHWLDQTGIDYFVQRRPNQVRQSAARRYRKTYYFKSQADLILFKMKFG